MSEPIGAGDLCEVVWGVKGDKSPNIGLRVKVKHYVGDDPHFGRIWRCEAEYAELWKDQPEADPKHPIKAPPGTADFAQSWLKKIEPPKEKTATETETEKTEKV